MNKRGEFGDLTLYRGYHIQNLEGFPVYWQGYPPMHYVTHALSPILSLLDTTVASVRCQGAGKLAAGNATGGFNNPYPTEVGLFTLRDSEVLADITMSSSRPRAATSKVSLYGDRRGIEWPLDNDGDPTVFDMFPPSDGNRGNRVKTRSLAAQDFPERLPASLQQFVRESEIQLGSGPTAFSPRGSGRLPLCQGDHLCAAVRPARRVEQCRCPPATGRRCG